MLHTPHLLRQGLPVKKRTPALCIVCIALTIAAPHAMAAETTQPRLAVIDSMIPNPTATAAEAGEESLFDGKSMAISLAQNEFEASQLIIEAPSDRPLRDVTVAIDPPRKPGNGGATWPRADCSLWRVEPVEVHNLWGQHESLGWFPDPLVPLANPFSVPAGKRQAVWVRLHAAPELPPGKYSGTLTVSASGKPIGDVPLEIEVYGFALPTEQHFTLSIPIWGGQMEKMHPGRQTAESRRAYLDMLYDHRVAPFPLEDDEIEYALQRGMRDFNLICFPKDHVSPETVEKAAARAAQWREKGWDKQARSYVLLGDEAPKEFYPNIQEQGRLMAKAAPEVARRFTVGVEIIRDFDWIFAQMEGAADTIILSASESYSTDAQTRKIAESPFGLWWYYVACHYYIPDGSGAGAAPGRHVFWRHWKYHVPGQLHWGMTYWGKANIAGKDGKKWPEIPWDTKDCRSGDGYVVYPSPDGARHYPSMRLEQIRDGIEDYEYFWLLKDLTDRLEKATTNDKDSALIGSNRALLTIDESLVKSYKHYSRELRAYRTYRQRLAGAILTTQDRLAHEAGPGARKP